MPSKLHEGLVHLFRQRPSLAADLLADLLADHLDVELPKWLQAHLDSGDLPEITPTEYRADAVVTLRDADGPVLAVVIEVQLRRDASKQWSWPVYLSTLRARLRCPTVLLVICPHTATAGWCATPIDLGHPGWVLAPLVLGPGWLPLLTDVEQARRDPELAVLSALSYRTHPDWEKVLHATLAGLADPKDQHLGMYIDVVLAALPAADRRRVEEQMSAGTYEYQSEIVHRFIRQGEAKGRAEGEAEGEAKGDRAATADSIRELFEQP